MSNLGAGGQASDLRRAQRAIRQISEDIKRLPTAEEVRALREAVAKLQTDALTETDILSLRGAVTQLQADVALLRTDLDPLLP